MTIRRFGSIGSCLLGLSAFGLGSLAQTVSAAPQKLRNLTRRANFLLVGNTLGWDCAAGTPQPVVGTVNSGKLRDEHR